MSMLIAYDGTATAQRALRAAAQLLAPRTVKIITAWEPVTRQTARALGRTGLHQTSVELETEDSGNDAAKAHALEILDQAIELAEELGLKPEAHLVEISGSVGQALLESAHELNASIIVTGTRGITGVRSWFTQSTAEWLVHNSDLPVFILPAEDDAEDVNGSSNPLSAW